MQYKDEVILILKIETMKYLDIDIKKYENIWLSGYLWVRS